MFKIDPEFKKLIPALAADERSQLEANIVADGCRDPLSVWLEEGLLLDGHNRFSICAAHGIEYEVNHISLGSRQAAVNWIINNQLGRRNVTPEQASYLRGKRYNAEKMSTPNPHGTNQHAEVKDQNDLQPNTAQRLADEYKVSEPTIKRDGKFAESIDAIADSLGESARDAILVGDSKVTKKDVVDAAEWLKTNKPAQAEEDDFDDMLDGPTCHDCAFFQSNYPDNWCTALERRLGTEDVIMLCDGEKWKDAYPPRRCSLSWLQRVFSASPVQGSAGASNEVGKRKMPEMQQSNSNAGSPFEIPTLGNI